MAITFITAIVTTLAGCVLAMTEPWVAPTLPAVLQLAGASFFVLVAYYSIIEAMRSGDVSAVAPFRYTVVLWATFLGYAVFGEIPTSSTIIGSAMIALTFMRGSSDP